VSNLPASGTIDVRLWYYGSGGWVALDYTYTGGSSAPSPQSAALGASLAKLMEAALRAVRDAGGA
jgi:hypothetical protein